MKKEFIGVVNPSDIEIEDGGAAKIVTFEENEDDVYGLFVKLCSWDEKNNHTEFNQIVGKKIKITIETIE